MPSDRTLGLAVVLAFVIGSGCSASSAGARSVTDNAPAPSAPATSMASSPVSPSTTVLRNTVVRYWGPIAKSYTDNAGLELVPPPAGAEPDISWQEAATPCVAGTGTNNCAPPTDPEDVFLASGTETKAGEAGPNNSIVPVMDRTLVYVIAERIQCLPAGPAPSPGQQPSTTAISPSTCLYLTFVDAHTDRGLYAKDSPSLRLPGHP